MSEQPRTQLDWEWMDWRLWGEELVESHPFDDVADTIANLGQQLNDLRRAMAAEAIIINAQFLSLNPRAIGKGRSEILREQIRRMLRCALAKEPPRSLIRWQRSYAKRVSEELRRFEDGRA